MNRDYYCSMISGSHLFGNPSRDSDIDLVHLFLPTVHDLVSNHRVVIPSNIENGVDNRRMLLGEFVQSLGVNPEHTLLYFQYRDLFEGLDPMWFIGQETVIKMVNSAKGMFASSHNAKNPGKQRGHAWRYVVGARDIWALLQGVSPYPLTGFDLDTYQKFRSGEFDDLGVDWDTFLNEIVGFDHLPMTDRATEEIDNWLLEEYWIGSGW